jgi:sialic acid synthase
MTRQLTIDGFDISDDSDCWVIAEIGHNHQGDVEKCKELIRRAHEAGANAAKLQKRDNRTLFTTEMFDSPYDNENSFGATYGEHREALEFNREQYVELREYAAGLGITFFATAFDVKSADFLAELDMPAFKLASGDLTNIPLLRHVARFGRPMIMSTGGGAMEDVQRAYDAVMPINPQLCILQCTASYPPSFEQLDLKVIETFRNAFPDTVIGLSAHDSGIAMALVAYVLGARVIEKHFTLNRAMKGTDHAFSLERPGLEKLVRDLRRARVAMGDGVKKRHDTEARPLSKMGKSLVAARDLPAGVVLGEADIAIRSPGTGLPPYHYDEVVGATLLRPLQKDEQLALADLRQRKPDARPA